jgi:hypothetical protein
LFYNCKIHIFAVIEGAGLCFCCWIVYGTVGKKVDFWLSFQASARLGLTPDDLPSHVNGVGNDFKTDS